MISSIINFRQNDNRPKILNFIVLYLIQKVLIMPENLMTTLSE